MFYTQSQRLFQQPSMISHLWLPWTWAMSVVAMEIVSAGSLYSCSTCNDQLMIVFCAWKCPILRAAVLNSVGNSGKE